jgi:hypothetical protein|tara:strand:- start:991 stop:1200 length:210 start_codon:yes stop_codon:yes gene_type:complete
MIIYVDKNKNGVYRFNLKERLKILFFGKIVYSQVDLKKSMNAWMTALFNLNDQLDEDVQKMQSNPHEPI